MNIRAQTQRRTRTADPNASTVFASASTAAASCAAGCRRRSMYLAISASAATGCPSSTGPPYNCKYGGGCADGVNGTGASHLCPSRAAACASRRGTSPCSVTYHRCDLTRFRLLLSRRRAALCVRHHRNKHTRVKRWAGRGKQAEADGTYLSWMLSRGTAAAAAADTPVPAPAPVFAPGGGATGVVADTPYGRGLEDAFRFIDVVEGAACAG